jgi:DNA-3-methyladenine glycosylase
MVAKELLGKYLVRKTVKGNMIGRITEVEAYLGATDKASHCYNFRKTEKTEIMYKMPGTLYVYYIYGMYFCLNVITEPPCAVFIRQLYPIEGIELMKKNRNVKIGKNYKNLTDGPSKLCIALNITKEKFNGVDSCSPDVELFFTKGERIDEEKILTKKRIGIDYAEEDKDRLLRFVYVD